MKRMRISSRLAWLALAAALASGCGAGSGAGLEASAAEARAKAQRDWKIQVDWAGAKTDLALDRMDIFLVEEEESEPEIFEIHGEGAVLVGQLPMDVHVGYGAEFEKLVGKTIALQSYGGDPGEPKTSWVNLGGTQVPLTGGSVTIQKFTGHWDGSEGDKTYWGTVELRVNGASGEQTVRGKFAVNCVTWG